MQKAGVVGAGLLTILSSYRMLGEIAVEAFFKIASLIYYG